MGNTNSHDQWAGRERLAFIERIAWWRGVVNRGDLRSVFGISAAQASADLMGYQDLNPTALAYNVRTKRYEARPEMVCRLHSPRIEDAVGMFLGAPVPLPQVTVQSGQVDVFMPPVRKPDASVERKIFLALDQKLRLSMTYWSVSSDGGKRREIAPHGLGHDGYRWHVRAWCFENHEFRDFVLSRIEQAEWPSIPFAPPSIDEAWEREVSVTLRANSELSEERRKTIERDYGMKDGKLQLQMREAMKEYCLAHLRIDEGMERQRHLDLDDSSEDKRG